MAKETKNVDTTTSNQCFIIMPLADCESYEKGHFKKVYEDILKVACHKAGFAPVRADEVKQTNLIHLDILQKLIESPIAICDLSNRNPNVLFEFGLRQAFDKPTVLVQEVGTQKIFDISPLRYTEYRKELKYREVLEDQNLISDALTATKEATDKGEGVNSIVSLLSLSSPASLKDITDNDATKMLQIIMSEMNDLRTDFRRSINQVLSEKDRSEVMQIKTKSDSLYDTCHADFKRFQDALQQNKTITDARISYDAFRASVRKAATLDMLAHRRRTLEELGSIADKLFAGYVSKNSQ